MNQISVALDRDHYKTRIVAGKNEILSDEPVVSGGRDEGMEPFELLLASIGSCTAITLRMYADRKSWPLEAIRIDLSLEQDKDRKTSCIHKEIFLEGNLDDAQKARLLEVADKCPTQRLMMHPVEFTSSYRNEASPGQQKP